MEAAPRDYRTTGLKLFVVALLVVLAIAVWWRRSRGESRKEIPSNERQATALLRVLARAEEDFRLSDRDGNGLQDYWTQDVSGLHKFTAPSGGSGRTELIPLSLAEADAASGKAKPYRGYYYQAVAVDRSKTRFAFCAYPAEYDRTGKWTFVINETGRIYRVDTSGEPIARWAPDPATWKLLD